MQSSPHLASRRGSAILVTILITVCLSIILFSVLDLGVFERRMNAHDRLMAQARYAAESVVENACAQAVRELKLNSWVASDHFSTANTKGFKYSALPDSFYTGTQVVSSSIELKVPDMTTVEFVKIPDESPDSLKGQVVEIRRLTFYSRATARDNSGREATAYCSETLQIRGQSPATNMAFYNMELELAPGPDMVATGPFFSNKSIYFAASNTLKIQGSVTTHGDLVWGRIVEDGLQAWTVDAAAQKGLVQIATGPADATGKFTMADFYNSGTYSDSLKSSKSAAWADADWQKFEQSQFKNNVQTRADGVAERSLPGIKDLADAHIVIEPPIVADTNNTAYNKEAELQKFSNKAGIIIRPAANASTHQSRMTHKTTTYTADVKDQSGKVIHKKGDSIVSSISADVTSATANTAFGSSSSTTIWAYVPESEKDATSVGPYIRENDQGVLGTYYLKNITSQVPTLAKIVTTTTGTSTSYNKDIPSEDLKNGFYDSREGAWLTMTNIDVAELKKAVADTKNPTLGKYWNGILYVDDTSNTAVTNTTSTDSKPVVDNWAKTSTVTTTTTTSMTCKTGVMLVNGGLGNLPKISPSYKSITDAEQGFTLATNDPLYIKGNFNANGSVSTTSPETVRNPDDETTELMACLAADTITVLSTTWKNGLSTQDKSAKTAGVTEVSAVFMTGLVGTHPNDSYSGGMHNLPRFLEYWGDNKAFGYRGSLLAFYYSKRATGLWANEWYQPPKRIWGWDKRLETGRKVYGLGRVITFRRTGFSEIDARTYTQKTSSL